MEGINIVSWNVRGVCNDVARANVRKLIRESRANILLLQETKCSSWNDIWSDGFWQGNNNRYEVSEARGLSGGLISSWLTVDFQFSSVSKSRFWIWLRGKQNGITVNIVNVYGPHRVETKLEVWSSLRELVFSQEAEPICLMGDFNCVCSREDKENCVYNQRDINSFNAFLRDCNLIEISDAQRGFTWFGPGNKKSKLDRVFVNDLWLTGRKWIVKKWNRRSSDHCPISIFLQPQDWGPKPFRGFNVWLKNADLVQLMTNEVSALVVKDELSWFGILRGVKAKAKEWSSSSFNELNSNILQLEHSIKNIYEGEVPRNNLEDFRSRLMQLYRIRSEILRQKSRIQWDLEGDSNTRFFHQSIQKRRAHNAIRGVYMNSVWVQDSGRVKEAFYNYFRNVFSEPHEEMLFQLGNGLHKSLSQEDQEYLESNFSLEEIELALKESNDNKAPGPDGLNFKWLKTLWPGIEQKVKEFFEKFYRTGDIPGGANSSFISLIPKVTEAKHMTDYRPISLINCSIKLLLKVLANRLKPRLSALIAEEQSAFIPGRNISDGILLANEVIHSMRVKGGEGIVMKIDFAKAYDSVNWNCLLHIMECMNFGPKWRMWILAILKSTKMSVLVNGSPTPEFKPGKGIRQGDPLAPYLFILIGEVLHWLLSESSRVGLIDGIEVAPGLEPITHLQYADDTILFFRDNVKSVRGIKTVLLLFQVISGLKINFGKSFIYNARNDHAALSESAAFLGCKVGGIPFPYLGAWIGRSPSKSDFWIPLINKIQGKLAGWKCKSLNEAGRITLLKACLDSIPNYWLGIHKIPKGVCRKIDVIRRRFLWGELRDPMAPCHRLHLIKWSTLLLPKDSGGLGLYSLENKNWAFLGKWWWRFNKERGRKWNEILRAKYGLGLYLDNNQVRDLSPILKGILSCGSNPHTLALFNNAQWRWILGNGSAISFWSDLWIGETTLECSFRRLFLLANDKKISVLDMLNLWNSQPSQHAVIWRRSLRGWETDIEQELGDILKRVELKGWDDRLIWNHSGGVYTVKQGYSLLSLGTAVQGRGWSKIWRIKVPSRIRMFLWKVAHKILPSKGFLNKRFNVDNQMCSWCNIDREDQDHILWTCQGAREVWESVSGWWEIRLPPSFFQGNLEVVLGTVTDAMSAQSWEITISATLWSLWLARNDRVFNNYVPSIPDIAFLIKKRSFDWCTLANVLPPANIWACYPKSASIFIQHQRKEKFLEFLFHKNDYVAFTDGACSRGIVQQNRGGMGGIVYNKSKDMVFIFYGPCDRTCIEDIELEAMCFASLKISNKWPGQNAVICSDSAIAVRKFQELKLNIGGPEMGLNVQDLGLDFIWACKVNKSWNSEADALAKQGLRKQYIIEGFL